MKLFKSSRIRSCAGFGEDEILVFVLGLLAIVLIAGVASHQRRKALQPKVTNSPPVRIFIEEEEEPLGPKQPLEIIVPENRDEFDNAPWR